MSVQIIDCVKDGQMDQMDALRYLEGIWQNRLATFEQNNGNINIRNEIKRSTSRLPEFVRDVLG